METEPSQISSILDLHQFAPLFLTGFTSDILTKALIIVILLIFSGLLSGSEVGFFSLGSQDKADFQEDGTASSARILKLLERPRYLLSTILIANNVVNIAIILVSNAILNTEGVLPFEPKGLPHFLVTIVLVTFLLVLFGEIAPKVYATQNKIRIVRLTAPLLQILLTVFAPISFLLVKSTNVVENRLRKRMNKGVVSQEDIASAIELTVKDNKNAAQEADMLKGIVRFGNTCAAEIMKPRMKVVALDINSSFEEVFSIFKEETYSRVPVYEGDLDNVKGIIHAKDLLDYLGREDEVDWHDLIRPYFVVPERRKIDDLFHDFQVKRTHIAIVVDEYGGTKGIVTLEDILEEIVGEIQDEFDQGEESFMNKIDDYTYDFDGSTPIIDICRALGIPTDFFDNIRGGAETIAGVLLVVNGTIPALNAPIEYRDYQFIACAASKRRIERVRVILPKEDAMNASSSASDK